MGAVNFGCCALALVMKNMAYSFWKIKFNLGNFDIGKYAKNKVVNYSIFENMYCLRCWLWFISSELFIFLVVTHFNCTQTRVYRKWVTSRWGFAYFTMLLNVVMSTGFTDSSRIGMFPATIWYISIVIESQTMVYRNSIKARRGFACFTMVWCQQSITDCSRQGMWLGTQWYSLASNSWCKPCKEIRTIISNYKQQAMEGVPHATHENLTI